MLGCRGFVVDSGVGDRSMGSKFYRDVRVSIIGDRGLVY